MVFTGNQKAPSKKVTPKKAHNKSPSMKKLIHTGDAARPTKSPGKPDQALSSNEKPGKKSVGKISKAEENEQIGAIDHKAITHTKTLSVSKVSGGPLSQFPVIFTNDSRYFFCCASTSIKIYSVATGELVRTLSSSESGHRDTITCTLVNPTDSNQLYSASLDGTVKLWDISDFSLLKTHDIGSPVTHMAIHPSDPDFIYVATLKASKKRQHQIQKQVSGIEKRNTIVLRFPLSSSANVIRLLKTKKCSGMCLSSDGEHLIVGASRKLHVCKAKGKSTDVRTYISPEPITCLALHPTEACIATGDEIGKITMWYCFSGEQIESPVTSVLHWHAHRVNNLAFSNDGRYLLSGGEEAVLVIWQLETGHRQFLPRLGSEIRTITISPDQRFYALGHMDNSVRIITSLNLQIKQAVQGLKYAQTNHETNPFTTGLVMEPRSRNIVLNGLPGTIQFYNARTDKHVLELEVSPTNRVTRSDNKHITVSHVDHVAFSRSGEWMATVDSRDDENTKPELYLKFWQFDPDTQSYILNTRADYPHEKEVTRVVFHPHAKESPMCVTVSRDGKFKVWQLQRHSTESTSENEMETAWTCRSTGYYRDYVPTDAAFSNDGSILAVAYGHMITLWDPLTNMIHNVLTQLPSYEPVQRLAFCSGSHFLVACTNKHLYVWNLLTCTVWWSCKLSVAQLSIDLASPHFVVSTHAPSNQTIFLAFNPESAVPMLVHRVYTSTRALLCLPRSNITSDPSHQRSLTLNSDIVFLDANWDLQILGKDIVETKAEAAGKGATTFSLEAKKPTSFFSDIFGASSASSSSKVDVDTTAVGKLPNKTQRVFNAPSHMLPPITMLFQAYMDEVFQRPASDEIDGNDGAQKEEESKEEQPLSVLSAIVPAVAENAAEDSELEDANSLGTLSAYFGKMVVANKNVNGTK
ncbi:uncharacterized protein VTP21DRAFT_5772 [Calcarisporiella thermophila]|uniref:uncharacterized protein n=1 Tax=Calcarisporiella thermophila TaxID=911321 RepID=UPI003742D999